MKCLQLKMKQAAKPLRHNYNNKVNNKYKKNSVYGLLYNIYKK